MEGISVVRAILCAVIGYLLGDIQTAVLISRHVYQDDVRKYGSHNAGTTNMTRVFGLRPGVITFLGDFLKGVAAYWAGYLLMGRTGAYIGSLFAVPICLAVSICSLTSAELMTCLLLAAVF